ncbi:T9SS type A sorting domain-containing protein [uncultured Coprobacter sp.]|uniref:T9SS type A sorting domain-containing protein n=1 Tax=uncultured Coprobacter sp. TaxID=1720550 RepID=UPI00263727B8|nr:T9SS type A sorting domain-containing protein [uncultured Coprobacter sp.]
MKKLIVVLTGLIVFSLCNTLQAQETTEFEGEFPSSTSYRIKFFGYLSKYYRPIENSLYNLSIQYTPSKPSLEIIEMIPTENYGCNLKIGFSSLGAESYTIEIIDEDAHSIWENPIDQQGYVTYTINDLFINGNYTIFVTAISPRGNIKSDPLHFNGLNISNNTIATQQQERYTLITNETIISNNKIRGTITDTNGHTEMVFLNENIISIKELPKGIYILSAKDESGKRIVQKFIK